MQKLQRRCRRRLHSATSSCATIAPQTAKFNWAAASANNRVRRKHANKLRKERKCVAAAAGRQQFGGVHRQEQLVDRLSCRQRGASLAWRATKRRRRSDETRRNATNSKEPLDWRCLCLSRSLLAVGVATEKNTVASLRSHLGAQIAPGQAANSAAAFPFAFAFRRAQAPAAAAQQRRLQLQSNSIGADNRRRADLI